MDCPLPAANPGLTASAVIRYSPPLFYGAASDCGLVFPAVGQTAVMQYPNPQRSLVFPGRCGLSNRVYGHRVRSHLRAAKLPLACRPASLTPAINLPDWRIIPSASKSFSRATLEVSIYDYTADHHDDAGPRGRR